MQTRLVTVLDTVVGQSPSLDLNFAAQRQLDPRITFTRASTGTFIGSNGLIQTAATNVPRFTHDPVTQQSLGLLIEESRTNLVLRSDDFANAVWQYGKGASQPSNASISTYTGTRPDGTTGTVYRFSFPATTNANDFAIVFQATTTSQASSNSVASSLWFKRVSGGTQIGIYGQSSTVPPNSSGGYVAAVVNLSSDWQRASAAGAMIGSPFGNWCLMFGGDSRIAGHAFAAVVVDVWGAQLEAGAFATSYIPTTGSAATRAADVATITGTDFSSWFNAFGGTLAAEGALTAAIGSRRMFTFGGTTLGVGTRTNGTASSAIWRTPTNFDAATGTVAAGTIRQAFAYSPGQLSATANGGAVGTSTPPDSLPATFANVGASETNFDYWSGPIARIRYWPRAMPSRLQTLTA